MGSIIPWRSTAATPAPARRLRSAGTAGAGLLLLSALPTSASADDPRKGQVGAPPALLHADMRIERLDNGLLVVILPLDTPGLVAVQTWMDIGARDEVVPGTTGYAHFFEHLMFHGSQSLPAEVRERRLLELGVDENAWTSEDNTVYHALAPASSLPDLLAIDADRFAHLHLVESEVRREAGAVQGEHRKSQADPDSAAWNALYGAAFRQHPYHHPVIGTDADVAAMPDGFVRVSAFLDAHYRPERATLIVAGDVGPDAALDLVRATHGGWTRPGGQIPRATLPVEPPQAGLRRLAQPWTGGPANPRLAFGWRLPAFLPGSEDGAAVQILADLLGAEVSPLHRRLVLDERLVRELWVPRPDARSPGLLVVWATLAEGADAARVEAILREEVAALSASPELPERVSLASGRARRALLLGLDSPAAWARAVGAASAYRGQPRDLEAHAAALGAVSPAAVQLLARELLVYTQLTIVTLAPPDALVGHPPSTPLPPVAEPAARTGEAP